MSEEWAKRLCERIGQTTRSGPTVGDAPEWAREAAAPAVAWGKRQRAANLQHYHAMEEARREAERAERDAAQAEAEPVEEAEAEHEPESAAGWAHEAGAPHVARQRAYEERNRAAMRATQEALEEQRRRGSV